MQTTNVRQVPVLSSDGQPLMPCHPARARKLVRKNRAAPCRHREIYAIQLTDQKIEESQVQDIVLNIDPGSRTTGIALTQEKDSSRTVLAALEIQHRAFSLRAKIQRRSTFRRTRRGRLRHRKPKHLNRRKPKGWIPPSVDSLRVDTMRVIQTIRKLYPVSDIRIERNRFDPHLMTNPNIWGTEYQQGPLFEWQLRAYILDRDQGRCLYCNTRDTRLEIDHVRPRATGSDRIDNLAACCRTCNEVKGNRPVEKFLAENPKLLEKVLKQLGRNPLAGATHLNIILPKLIESLEGTGIRVEQCDAATTSWNRKELGIPKTHCYDAALLGFGITQVTNLPELVLSIKPANGTSKQKGNVDRHGTPVGRPFRNNCRLRGQLKKRNPAPGHAGRAKRFGTELIGTGDTVLMQHRTGELIGRAVIQDRGTRIKISGKTPKRITKISAVKLLRRNPGHIIDIRPPTQQQHRQNDPCVGGNSRPKTSTA